MAKTKIIAQERTLSMGLDTDSKSSVVYVLDVESGEELFVGRVLNTEKDWTRFLKRFPECRIWACYEASGSGYYLYRLLISLEVDCRVIAPSKVPKTAENKKLKTDRRDAYMLATIYFHPPKYFVRVPTEQEAADRELVRTREQLMKQRVRLMLQIKSMLAFHHMVTPPGVLTNWRNAFRDWLRHCDCSEEIRNCLDVFIDLLESVENNIEILNRKIAALSRSDLYRERCDRLCSQLKGVGTLTAMTFLVEMFRIEDFRSASALACHVGLTPSEWSSGKRRRLGHITRWGPAHLRKILIEAAWIWCRHDPKARMKHEKIRGGAKHKVAVVAMARRLAITMWAMTVKGEDYNYRWAD